VWSTPQSNIELMSQEESAMTSRALLVKIRDLENQIRGQSRSLTRTCRPHRYGRSYRRELGIQIDLNYRFHKRDE